MYTIIWQEDGLDRWDRLETKEEVDRLVDKLSINNAVCLEDVWIFSPEADEFASTPDEF